MDGHRCIPRPPRRDTARIVGQRRSRARRCTRRRLHAAEEDVGDAGGALVYEQVLTEGTDDEVRYFVVISDLIELWQDLVRLATTGILIMVTTAIGVAACAGKTTPATEFSQRLGDADEICSARDTGPDNSGATRRAARDGRRETLIGLWFDQLAPRRRTVRWSQ